MKTIQIMTLFFLTILQINTAIGDEDGIPGWKDPRTRDEDLSKTKISVSYKVLASGLYEYFYEIENSIENKGTISIFKLNLACEYDFGPVVFEEPPIDMFMVHESANTIPIQADGVWRVSTLVAVGANSEMLWGMKLRPGEDAKGFRLTAPAKPSLINYGIEPFMEAFDWDYDSYDENDPTVPWIPDFTVTGMILGPACPSADGSPSEEAARFPGSNKHSKESAETNNLLSYQAPFLDQFHVADNVKEIEMIIHYDKSIDSKTFKVKPKKLRKYFNPVAGTTQTLKLPLKKFTKKHKKDHKGKLEDVHIAKIKLEVKARRIDVGKIKKHHKSKQKDHHAVEKSEKLKAFISQVKEKHEKSEDKRRPKDKDVFTIRIDH